MNEIKTFKNFAFISYSHKDIKQAERLDNFLLDFRLPVSVKQKYPDRRDSFKDIFRDNTGMGAATDLSSEIRRQLDQSEYLIVVCSPNAVESGWVNEEIEYFKSIRGQDYIYPFVVDGIVNAKSPDESHECMPKALRPYKGRAANITTYSFEHAIIEILAAILKIEVDEIWQRHVRLEEERKKKLEEQNNRLLIAQSRFIAEKAKGITNDGDVDLAIRLLLEVLPKDLDNPDRPYTLEAESAFRFACKFHTAKLIILTDGVKFASISPDGKQIVSASGNNTYQVWDTETGQKIMQLEISSDSLTTVIYSNGEEIINKSDNDNSQHIWDNQTEEILGELIRLNYRPNSVFFSKEGQFIVTASNYNVVVIWDARSGKQIMKFEKNLETCHETLLDGHSVASLDWTHAGQILDAETLKEIKMSTEFVQNISSLVFSSNGKYLISSSDGMTIRIWELEGMKRYYKIENLESVSTISYSSDGKYIVAASNEKIILWSTETKKEILRLIGHKHSVNSVSFSPDGKRIVSSALYDTVIVWDVETGIEQLRIKERTYKVNSVAFSPDGKCIVAATGEEDADDIFKLSYDYSVLIWNSNTGELAKEFRGHSYIAHSAVFSSNGQFVASASSDKTVRIWDTESSRGLKIFKGHVNKVHTVVISPDGTKIISGSEDHTIRIWNVKTGKELLKLSSRNNSVSLSPDGKRIISAAGKIQIWDIETGYELWEIKDNCVYATMSPDGKMIASIDSNGTVKIWELSGLQDLINVNRTCYKNYPLSSIERKRYYLE